MFLTTLELLVALCAVVVAGCDEASLQLATRDKMMWPFVSRSIWNTPIGSTARFVPANIFPAEHVGVGTSILVTTRSSDPLRMLLAPGSPDRCSGTQALGTMMNVPDDFVMSPQMNASPGLSASFLQPDEHSLIEISGLARCEAGGPIYGFRFPDSDLYGDGRLGGQGGSGLSALGGTLRLGELTNGLPVRHALKVSLWGRLYYFHDAANPNACFRWPADRCDAQHASSGDEGYGGNNPEFAMGALLAIPPTETLQGLNIETDPGKLLFVVLQNYGAYVVGNVNSNVIQLSFEQDAKLAFEQTMGDKLPAFHRDINRLLPLLSVVANNGPSSVGGGGEPRRPLPPPLEN